MTLSLYNTLTRSKEPFAPSDPARVGMYVCGPTVYDDAHIGNARPIIVFDLLFRLLRHHYGDNAVTYVRNITDVDDKINARAHERRIPIQELTAETIARFHADIARLGALEPTVEPTATGHISEMRDLIETLVAKEHAYVAEDHVLFSVASFADYGTLSRRSTDEMEAGARVEVAPFKRDPMDFVLWKPSKDGEPGWPSPCGIPVEGRPGWHIECSAMAGRHLGETFDIHGGGIDLAFPHHENERAQSCAAHDTDHLAKVWMHNGFLQVEGEKMSKSLGNFITINQLLDTQDFGGQRWHGRVIRWAMLTAHYRQPIDWTVDRLLQARTALMDFADLVADASPAEEPYAEVVAALDDDLNTPRAMSVLFGLAKSARRGNTQKASDLKASLTFMGVYGGETRDELRANAGTAAIDEAQVEALVAERLKARNAKDWAESDRLRDALAAMGVQVKDGKDPETGAATTTWEVMQ